MTNTRNSLTRRTRRGFTLLEIVVVVTIIALLATLVAPRLLGQLGGARRNAALSEASSIAQQVNLYLINNNMTRPPDDMTLEWLTEGDDPLLKADDLVDPWGNPYVLIVPGEYNIDFDVVSYGDDGEPGGEGDGADIIHGQKETG